MEHFRCSEESEGLKRGGPTATYVYAHNGRVQLGESKHRFVIDSGQSCIKLCIIYTQSWSQAKICAN